MKGKARRDVNWIDRAEQAVASIGTAAVMAIGGGFMWMVRTLLTNQRQIALLQSEIHHRDKLRTEDREAIIDVRESVKRIETVLMGDRK